MSRYWIRLGGSPSLGGKEMVNEYFVIQTLLLSKWVVDKVHGTNTTGMNVG